MSFPKCRWTAKPTKSRASGRCWENVEIRGKVVTGDAMHTQVDHANYIVKERKADYFFTVKENQPTLLADIEAISEEDFSPCAHRDRQGTRAD